MCNCFMAKYDSTGKLVPFAELSVAHASVLTILAISLERYIAICRPLRANYTCTKQRAVLVCVGIWIIGCIATRSVNTQIN